MTDKASMSAKEQLIAGYQAFRAGDFKEQKSLYETLGKKGQSPKVMLIGCADSRVDPTDIFNAYPGEMFVARNVANIVPPHDNCGGNHSTAAAIEYAVTVLKVETIVVMGHESCGGVKGCLDGMGDPESESYVGKWVSLINQVRDRVLSKNYPVDQIAYQMELETVRQSLDNLMTLPFVKHAVDGGQLTLQGAYFSIIRAQLLMSDEVGEFSVVPAA